MFFFAYLNKIVSLILRFNMQQAALFVMVIRPKVLANNFVRKALLLALTMTKIALTK